MFISKLMLGITEYTLETGSTGCPKKNYPSEISQDQLFLVILGPVRTSWTSHWDHLAPLQDHLGLPSLRTNFTQDHSGPLRTTQDHLGLLRTTQDQLGPLRTTQDHLGPLRTSQDHLGPLRTSQDHLRPLRTTQDQLGPVHLGALRTTQDHLGPLRTTQDH